MRMCSLQEIEFFVPMDKLPTVTAQQKGVTIIKGKPHFYKKKEVQEVEEFFEFILKTKKPQEAMTGAVALTIGYHFPAKKPHKDGQPKVTRPDTDNLIKLVKDVLTRVGFWIDDSQVFCETYYKVYLDTPGLWFSIKEYNVKDRIIGIRQEVQAYPREVDND